VRIAHLLVTAAILAVSGCGSTSDPSTGQYDVAVRDNSFSSSSLTVPTGTTVTFSWKGSSQHNVTWVAAGEPAPSPTQSTGSYQRTFGTPGTYVYYCTIHGTPTSGMRGTITVQ
jgi:plastocyanin